MTDCPICGTNCSFSLTERLEEYKYSCPRCGNFYMSVSATEDWRDQKPTERQKANASGWLGEHEGILVSSNEIELLLSIPTPSVTDRATKILLALEKRSSEISTNFNFNQEDIKSWLGVSYSTTDKEFWYLLKNYLAVEVGFVSYIQETLGGTLFGVQITPKGYAFIDSIKHTNAFSQIGFCAMWFSNEILPAWANAISPAIYSAGYEPKRIDSHPHNNKIDDEIVAMIRRSKFVVADFTGQRGGVYFEAGFALGLGLPVIWTCEKSDLEKVHFDNRQYNFVLWEKDKLPEFKYALQNRIEATLGRGSFS